MLKVILGSVVVGRWRTFLLQRQTWPDIESLYGMAVITRRLPQPLAPIATLGMVTRP
jgi:hypothetical protein